MDNEQLVILGNGFDLALGLATSYDDFFKWIKTEDTISTIPPIKEDSSEEETAVLEQQILEDLKTKRVNVWVYYFCQLDHTLKGWNNVESVIKDVIINGSPIAPNVNITIKEYLKHSFFASTLIKNLLNVVYDVITEIDKTGLSKNLHIYDLKDDKTKIYPFLLLELNRFETLFKEYLNSKYFFNKSHNYKYYKQLAKNLLFKMDIDISQNNYHILDFNYTYPITNEANINNIHGLLGDDNIIFGIDATKVDSNTPYYQFTKESRIMHNSLKPTFVKKKADILNKSIKEIKFFGHSLAEADYAYFQSIFDYLNIYDSDVILIFYYGNYLNVHKAELAEYEHQIQKLLSIYGTTLDNKDHGKNIMTKLMLENRLQIEHVNTAGL